MFQATFWMFAHGMKYPPSSLTYFMKHISLNELTKLVTKVKQWIVHQLKVDVDMLNDVKSDFS